MTYELAELLREHSADIYFLQELDRLRISTGLVDQPAFIAKQLGLEFKYCPTVRFGFGQYGHAIASRLPILSTSVHLVPCGREARKILEVRLATDSGGLRAIGFHADPGGPFAEAQLKVVCEMLYSGDEEAVLGGDLNAGVSNAVVRSIYGDGTNSNFVLPEVLTFPSWAPTVQLDHMVSTIGWTRTSLHSDSRIVSDHLALVATFRHQQER